MRYVAAALLAALGGNDINAKNIEKILKAAGVDADSDEVSKVASELAGKNIEELIAEGKEKMSSVPSGAAPAAAGGAPAAAAADAPKAEAKKEEEEEEEDDDMGFGLFD
uniref:Large ribosomal subunit protein P2 n=1 Tax=Centropages tenuiremis TaxID=544689 RepID=A0A0U2UPZ2_9MAXI|nr:60S acidic ribosomal protein P2 [Centropages tenuiremis]